MSFLRDGNLESGKKKTDEGPDLQSTPELQRQEPSKSVLQNQILPFIKGNKSNQNQDKAKRPLVKKGFIQMKILQTLSLALIFSAGVLFLCSCKTKEIIPSEVLQMPEYASLHTAYNIWYTDPEKIDSLNILKGEIIPFGTEVEIIYLSEKEFRFRTLGEDSREFVMRYDQQKHMIPAEEFIRKLFTTKNQIELAEGIRPLIYEKIKRGIVDKGMTKEEVILAYGHPAAYRTPSEEEDTWLFWTDYLVGKRLIFSKGKLLEIIVL